MLIACKIRVLKIKMPLTSMINTLNTNPRLKIVTKIIKQLRIQFKNIKHKKMDKYQVINRSLIALQ